MNTPTAVTDEVAALLESSDEEHAKYIAALLWQVLMTLKPTTVSANEILVWLRSQLVKTMVH